MIRVTVIALALSGLGCSMGFGSAYVGQWRAHDDVEYRACLEDDTGKCIAEKERVQHVPERSYSGAILAYPAMGVSWVTREGATTPRWRVEPSLEILHGRGRAAYGVRVGALFESHEAISIPAMLVGHFSLTEWLGVYGGLGYLPYARLQKEQSTVGARGLLGFQFVLARVGETYWVISAEADTLFIAFDQPYRSTGFTTHLGVFF
jgi:hypothetical protein